MYEFDLDGTVTGRKGCSDVSVVTINIDGKPYTVPQLVKLKYEVESLRKENVALNKDCSALHNTIDGLQKQVYNYQDTIANNLTGIRCKELEGEVEQLKKQVSDLEEIIRDDVDTQSEEICNLQTELDSLEEAYDALLGLFLGKRDEVKEQQAIIECLENDIKRLVKLNGVLTNEHEELKSKQNIVGDYLKGFVATSLSNNFVCGDLSLTVRGYVGETEISITILDKENSTEAAIFANTLLTQNH